jgi:ferredoxin
MSNAEKLVISIDESKCQGHNRCYALAPQLVDVDEWGQASVRGDGMVPDEFHEKAALLVANCPEFAIKISRVTEKKPE